MITLFVLIIIGFPIGLYFLRRKLGFIISLNSKIIWIIRVIFILSFILFMFLIYLSKYDLSFRGKDSTSIIFIISTLSSIILYLFDLKIFKGFKYLISTYTFVFGGMSIMYFLIFVLFAESKIYYNDNNYRVAQTYKGFLRPRTAPDLFVKQGLFEKKYDSNGEYLEFCKIDSVKVSSTLDSLELILYHNDSKVYYEKYTK